MTNYGGVETSDIEIITNPKEGISRSWDLIRSANREMLIMVSTANAFRRQLKMGIMNLFKEVCKEGAVKIRMLIPAASDEEMIRTLNELSLTYPQQIVDFRIADESLRFRITVILIDKKYCIIIETKDDYADNSYDVMGLTTYSNSKSIVLSYASILEGLWKQSELYEQLKVHDKMQKEFINIAAHELRTPVQPILSFSQLLQSDKSNNAKEQEFLDAIVRNAKRLQRITENILDVTRIESPGLGLFISKSIIEAHGGKIWAQNNTDGIGATFAFSLPLDK